MGARSGGVQRPSHAQHIPNNRCTNQNHLLSISLTFSLDALPAARFFTPGTRLILLSSHEPPKLPLRAQFSWQDTTPLLHGYFSVSVRETKDCTSLKHYSKWSHLSQTLIPDTSTTYCNDQIGLFASPLLPLISIN